MKKSLLYSLAFLSLHSALAAPLVQAPGASPQAFQEALAAQPHMISIVDIYKNRAQQPLPQEENLFAVADQLSRPTSELLAEIKSVHEEQRLSETGMHFLRDFLNKISNRQFSNLERNEMDALSCLGDSLLENQNPRCKMTSLNAAEIKQRFPWAQTLVIEYKAFDLIEGRKASLDKRVAYHFQILSATHKNVEFYGTVEQLLQQSFAPETWVSGSCDGFTTSVDDFALTQEALAFFSSSCTKALKNPPPPTSWVSRNKYVLLTAGAVVLGGIVYAMKDKKMVIDTSAFK